MPRQHSFLLLLLIAISCNKRKHLNSLDKHYLGEWLESSDEIVLGTEKPTFIMVESNEMKIQKPASKPENFKIEKIFKEGDRIVIEGKMSGSAEVITLKERDGFLYFIETVPTGIDDETSDFVIGKFYKR